MTTGELTSMFSYRDADPDEPDDGRDGFRHDHDGEGERRTSCRSSSSEKPDLHNPGAARSTR